MDVNISIMKMQHLIHTGMFRPEMLLPMGLPEGVNCIGFGLSLERPTMIKYKIDNIRDLVGHKVNLDMVKKNPLCRIIKAWKKLENYIPIYFYAIYGFLHYVFFMIHQSNYYPFYQKSIFVTIVNLQILLPLLWWIVIFQTWQNAIAKHSIDF